MSTSNWSKNLIHAAVKQFWFWLWFSSGVSEPLCFLVDPGYIYPSFERTKSDLNKLFALISRLDVPPSSKLGSGNSTGMNPRLTKRPDSRAATNN